MPLNNTIMESNYQIRSECIICKNKELTKFFDNDYSTFLSFSVFDKIKKDAVNIPFNIVSCNKCFTIQTLYIGNINVIYGDNHVDNYGYIKNDINDMFSKFILNNKLIKGPIEVGACMNSLCKLILNNIETNYTIIEPGYKGEYMDKLNIINGYFENVNIKTIDSNTIIMSNVFEHFYNPTYILDKLRDSTNIEYIYLCHPNFEHYCIADINNILNFEHIFYIELEFLINLFKLYNFELEESEDYKSNYFFLKFKRIENSIILNDITFKNSTSLNDTTNYFKRMHERINKINMLLEDSTCDYYFWPCSAHTITLFMNGLKWDKLTGVLDNSPNKIGKYIYGYNLKCEDMNKKLSGSLLRKTKILLTGAGLYLNELNINDSNVEIIFINNLN
jgi:hypothetical protein